MPLERVITVEYLQPSMSKELLYKFPDNFAFGFDYSQSGIWSPPIPRRFPALVDLNVEVGRRQKEKKNKLTEVKGKKIAKRKRKSNVKNHAASSDVSNSKFVFNKTDLPTPHLGWTKVLRAATKRLKKTDQ